MSFRKFILYLIGILLIAVAAFIPYTSQQRKINNLNSDISKLKSQIQSQTIDKDPPQISIKTDTYKSQKGTEIKVYVPAHDAVVSNPLVVLGEVPGNWSFEASFPARLEDAQGNVLATSTASLLSDWMTEKLVPFSLKFEFEAPNTDTGMIILQKDNPSGLDQNQDSASIPVRFK